MPQPPAQTLLIFFLGAAALHGAWLCVLFFLKKQDRLLALALAAVTLYLFNYLLFLTGIIRQWVWLLGWLLPFIYLAGPAFYFFVKKSLSPHFIFEKKHLLHLLPFVYGWWQMLPVFALPLDRKKVVVEYLLDPASSFSLADILKGNIHIYVLLGYAATAWFFSNKMEQITQSPENQAKAKWHRRFCIFFMFLLLLDLSLKIGTNLTSISASNSEYLLAGLLAISLHWVGYHALGRLDHFPKILSETAPNGKYRSSPLDAARLNAAKSDLLDLMENKKPYLDPDLKIAALAERLGMPSHHLSQVLNETLGVNFNDFVNGYRIAEVKRRLSNGKHRHLTIEALGLDCGFSSKTTFNRVFRKMAGCTPIAYRERTELP